jgi:1-acyl-sn-glycerol-3-phosphate acyltransferase
MGQIFNRLYSIYAFGVFIVTFIILIPFYLIFVQRESWHSAGLFLNRIWAKVFFVFTFLPVEQKLMFKPEHGKRYVFCPNHTSYLDIPVMGLIPHQFVFVGKSSIERVPLFGYMFRKLHITVNRDSIRSKYSTYLKASKAIENKRSLVIFPEGGIVSQEPPRLARFKDGAFRIAIEKQIPVIPVIIPYNWIVLPDNARYLLFWHKVSVIYHEPISTAGMTLDNLGDLKKQVFEIIDSELKRLHPQLQNED